jgi:peptidoglycan hydrolase-like protein with peptidoglycan-binding domain
VQSPRENQNVQSPRENQDVQSPRGKQMGATHSVRAGQAALKAQGFDPGDIDGVYGPSTHAALTNYQRSNGLRETGRFDHATLAKLGVGSMSR